MFCSFFVPTCLLGLEQEPGLIEYGSAPPVKKAQFYVIFSLFCVYCININKVSPVINVPFLSAICIQTHWLYYPGWSNISLYKLTFESTRGTPLSHEGGAATTVDTHLFVNIYSFRRGRKFIENDQGTVWMNYGAPERCLIQSNPDILYSLRRETKPTEGRGDFQSFFYTLSSLYLFYLGPSNFLASLTSSDIWPRIEILPHMALKFMHQVIFSTRWYISQ